tara:strand:- start:31980 stop:34580 length:2601 start_codon:yes stop_codon:yes gene_type:complete
MAKSHNFEHLPLLFRVQGPARFPPGGKANPITKKAQANRAEHVSSLKLPARNLSENWITQQRARSDAGLPTLPVGVPILLKIDPNLDVDQLRKFFEFEIISEEGDGFVIVASEDIELIQFHKKLDEFEKTIRGSGSVASIHELDIDTLSNRLERILSEMLLAEWSSMPDDGLYLCDLGIACTGTWQIKSKPKQGRQSEEKFKEKLATWEQSRREAYEKWDDLHSSRSDELRQLVKAYDGEVLAISSDDFTDASPLLPEDFTVRIKIKALGLRDIVLNYPYIFEVVEPEDVLTPQSQSRTEVQAMNDVLLIPPDVNHPAVCVIDSGIQEGHFWLSPAIRNLDSTCFLPGTASDISDHTIGGGHGTRVAGAILYGSLIPTTGTVQLTTWIQNAKVLDSDGKLPDTTPPHSLMRTVVERFHQGENKTRVFNQSINATSPSRTKHMSAWAAEIDILSYENDILVVQSSGNIPSSAMYNQAGVTDKLRNGESYPEYLRQPSCRIANPSQSFQALTVGSVAHDVFSGIGWKSFATKTGDPSAFTRTGLGIWGSIKPEVVEYGGDFLYSASQPSTASTPTIGRDCYPELLRSTINGGPAYDKDGVGTSFSAPKVSRIAAHLQNLLPDHSCLLYRALIVQSAKWPEWSIGLEQEERTDLLKYIGYGIPDIDRATTNTDFRVTFISSEDTEIAAGECHLYQVRIPDSLRAAASDHNVGIEVTLSYAAVPRRTRQSNRGYLSVWLDWMSSRRGEIAEDFQSRAIKDESPADGGTNFKWTIGRQSTYGKLRDVRRSTGTIQKDWTNVKSHDLPEDFCIAIRGHKGWSHDPEATARYRLAVTLEAQDQDISIYEPLQIALEELRLELDEIESRIEVRG